MTPEQQARQQIDAQLLASGWIVRITQKLIFPQGVASLSVKSRSNLEHAIIFCS